MIARTDTGGCCGSVLLDLTRTEPVRVEPRLALCADRSVAAKGPDMVAVLRASLSSGTQAGGFHYFVEWDDAGRSSWSPHSWRTVLYEGDIQTPDEARDVAGDQSWFFRLASRMGHDPLVVLLAEPGPTDFVWMSDRSGFKAVARRRFLDAIRAANGGPMRIGAKGLTWGTSCAECALSRTETPYPGDVDAVVTDDGGRPVAVVEFKKHAIDKPMGDHLAAAYYPSKDGRKYRRLWTLCERYGLPLHVLYHSTRSDEARVQRIEAVSASRLSIWHDTGSVAVSEAIRSIPGART